MHTIIQLICYYMHLITVHICLSLLHMNLYGNSSYHSLVLSGSPAGQGRGWGSLTLASLCTWKLLWTTLVTLFGSCLWSRTIPLRFWCADILVGRKACMGYALIFTCYAVVLLSPIMLRLMSITCHHTSGVDCTNCYAVIDYSEL